MAAGPTSPLRILHLEDDPNDAELIQATLQGEGLVCRVTRVETRAEFVAALGAEEVDVILADYTLPAFDGLSALRIALERCPDVPFIFVSGTLGEEVAIEALKIGATDYLLKERLAKLGPSVRRALREAKERIERKRAEEAARAARARFQGILEIAQDAIISVDSQQRIVVFNQGAEKVFGYTQAEVIGRPLELLLPQRVEEVHRKYVEDFGQSPDVARAMGQRREVSGRRRDGGEFAAEASISKLDLGGELVFTVILRDITERKRAEDERQVHLQFLESMDRVNRAIQGTTNDLEHVTSDVLHAVLAIFDCDRAWLVYPCDPEALSWRVPMEHARPEFPGAFALGAELPVDEDVARVFRVVGASRGPVRFGPGSEHPLPAEAAKRFRIQSMMAMAIHPRGDRSYMLGLHQCAYPRVWTPQEERVFQEIGRRLEDALTSVLMFRNLGESERRLEAAQRISHVGYWERDLATNRYTWSDEAYRIFGLAPQARTLGFDDVQELVHPSDRARRAVAIAAALQGGAQYDVEYRAVRPSGEVRFVRSQGNVVRDETGEPRRVFGTVQDITERKWAEQRLMAQHTVTQILAEAATLEEATPKILRAVCECLVWDVGALWRPDREAGVLRCVEIWHRESKPVPEFEAASRQSTFGPGIGLPGRVWLNREPAYIPDVVRDANFLRAPVAAREVLHAAFGVPILLRGDVLGVVEFFSREIREPDRVLLAMMVTIGSQIGQFIERKQAEAALRQTQAELAHVTRVATLGEMTTSIAHETHQPLAAIVNNATACLNWLAAQNLEEARQSAEFVIADSHRAAEIIDRIRALTKKAPSRKDALDVNETILAVIALARSEMNSHGVSLRMQLADDLPLVVGDRIQVQQVILNLMINAIEAMSGTGDAPRELSITSARDHPQGVLVAVADSGPGLNPASRDRLFTPFYTTKPQGMGMGLAISRSIVETHGGRLWPTANVPRGAVFQFTLPTGGEESA